MKGNNDNCPKLGLGYLLDAESACWRLRFCVIINLDEDVPTVVSLHITIVLMCTTHLRQTLPV